MLYLTLGCLLVLGVSVNAGALDARAKREQGGHQLVRNDVHEQAINYRPWSDTPAPIKQLLQYQQHFSPLIHLPAPAPIDLKQHSGHQQPQLVQAVQHQPQLLQPQLQPVHHQPQLVQPVHHQQQLIQPVNHQQQLLQPQLQLAPQHKPQLLQPQLQHIQAQPLLHQQQLVQPVGHQHQLAQPAHQGPVVAYAPKIHVNSLPEQPTYKNIQPHVQAIKLAPAPVHQYQNAAPIQHAAVQRAPLQLAPVGHGHGQQLQQIAAPAGLSHGYQSRSNNEIPNYIRELIKSQQIPQQGRR